MDQLALCSQPPAKTDTLWDLQHVWRGDKKQGGLGGRSQHVATGVLITLGEESVPFVTSQKPDFAGRFLKSGGARDRRKGWSLADRMETPLGEVNFITCG